MPARWIRRPGFTLLEVMAALAIVGIVLAGALTAAAADLRASRKAADTVEAVALVEELIARVSLMSSSEVRALEGGTEDRFDPPMDRYRWRLESEPLLSEQGLMQVRVTVSWLDGSVSMVTRIARPLSGTPPEATP